MSQILVVCADRAEMTAVVGVFANAGYTAAGATTFEEARERLVLDSPAIVIAEERLDAYNGIHVLLTARAVHPYADLIIVPARRNRALEADARSLNVHCVVKPRHADEWVAAIDALLSPIARVA